VKQLRRHRGRRRPRRQPRPRMRRRACSARTALVTLSKADIGVMSCNPAIGGLGKGHLVREIDALDGVMGRVADRAGIQFRLLNRRKGPAVQGRAPRPTASSTARRCRPRSRGCRLTVVEGEAVDLLMDGPAVVGVGLADGTAARQCRGGADHRHLPARRDPYRRGFAASRRAHGRGPGVRLAERIEAMGVPLGRLKTGTPPRLDGRTIDWDGLETSPAMTIPVMFSFLSERPLCGRSPAGSPTPTRRRTRSSARTCIVRRCMAAISKGLVPATAPRSRTRSCASPTRTSHQVFLEPEGWTTIPSIPTAFPAPCPRMSRSAMSAPSAAWRMRHDPPARLRHRVRLCRSPRAPPNAGAARCPGLFSPVRSTAPPATRRRRRRASSPG
jgi:tRNA uridine 5-carboxymethylaminomethyl modification enzyme